MSWVIYALDNMDFTLDGLRNVFVKTLVSWNHFSIHELNVKSGCYFILPRSVNGLFFTGYIVQALDLEGIQIGKFVNKFINQRDREFVSQSLCIYKNRTLFISSQRKKIIFMTPSFYECIWFLLHSIAATCCILNSRDFTHLIDGYKAVVFLPFLATNNELWPLQSWFYGYRDLSL